MLVPDNEEVIHIISHAITTKNNDIQYRVSNFLKDKDHRVNENQKIQNLLYIRKREVPKIVNRYKHNNAIYAVVSQTTNLKIMVYKTCCHSIYVIDQPYKCIDFNNSVDTMNITNTTNDNLHGHTDQAML